MLRRDDFVYVADSKLCTEKNLSYIQGYGGKFVTVLPRTRAEDIAFRQQLRSGQAVRWRRLVVRPNSRRSSGPPDVYWTTGDGPNETREDYRIVWFRSSLKAECDRQARERAIEKARAELFDLRARISRDKRRRRRGSILRKARSILRERGCESFLTVDLRTQTYIQLKRLRRGRPRKEDPVREVRRKVFHLEVRRDVRALRAEARTDGVFPLVTNLARRKAPKKEVLLIYKDQPYVEKRHALFKSEFEVAPVYLKKPHRVCGLLHATFLAMTLDALIERTLRQAMAREGIQSLPILPEGRPTKTPTTARLLEMFSGLAWYEFEQGEHTVTFPIRLSPLQKQLLKLLEIDPLVYA